MSLSPDSIVGVYPSTTRRMDAEIAGAFLGDARRLQQDVLGDAVRDLLAKTELALIR